MLLSEYASPEISAVSLASNRSKILQKICSQALHGCGTHFSPKNEHFDTAA